MENIILKSREADRVFEYSMEGQGLILGYEDDGIGIYKEDRLVYTVEIPYVHDDKGNYTEVVEVKITEENSFTVSLRNEWRDRGERAYPVMV